jgi:DNA-binding CsgD family transcriptional regulator
MKVVANTSLAEALCEITNAATDGALKTAMRSLATRYGVRSAAYLGAGLSCTHVEEPYLAVTYSSDWVEHYKDRRYVEIDPVVRLGIRRLLPLDWDEFGKPEGMLKNLFGEASEFGLGRRGLTIPVHGRGGDHALFTITSDLSEREWRSEKLQYMRDFQLLAVHLHDKVLELEGRPVTRANLSPRELECLQWVSDGKTAWECSVILGLSEHTVRCYLESARYKLNASSNTHAVSIAHRTGLFSPVL